MRFIRHPSKDTPRSHAKDAIEQMILARGYKVGQKLPTYRDLAAHFDIAVRTVERVMRQMADEGTVQLLHGKGAFVRKLPAGSGRLVEVGLVYPASRLHLIRTPYLNQILCGMIIQCDIDHIDLQIVAFREAGHPQYAPVSPRDLSLRVDGMLLLEVVNEPYIAEFARESIPLVLVDTQTNVAPLPAVCMDNAAAVRQVMEHLYGLGHRQIAYVESLSEDPLAQPGKMRWVDAPDGRERREAYLTEIRRLDLSYQQILPGVDGDMTRVADSVARQLKQDRRRPTALVAYDEPVAGLLCQALDKAGLRVPQDLSVAGVIGTEGTNVAGPLTVTCALAPFEEMGRRAITMLLGQVTGKPLRRGGVQRVGCVLQVGSSTTPPRRR